MADAENEHVDPAIGDRSNSTDKLIYILDLTLELQRMASKAGLHEMAVLLLEAHEHGRRLHDNDANGRRAG